MTFKKCLVILACCLPGLCLIAQPAKAPDNWFTKDQGKDGVQGTSSDEALRQLKAKGKKGQTIIVAVLDSGVDYMHEDLKDIMWVNPGEIAGNGIDDDKNGYIDDVHGWNFIGGKDGKNVSHDTYELTREYARLSKKYANADPSKLSGDAKKEYEYFKTIRTTYEEKRGELEQQKEEFENIFGLVEKSFAAIAKALGKPNFTAADLANVKTEGNEELQQAVGMAERVMSQGLTPETLAEQKNEAMEYVNNGLNYSLNTEFDPRPIVGDNYNDLTNRIYGNNDVKGPDASHGTHVAGIIAAVRDNGKGVNGIADNVRIMSVRCVPDGDERDKDVANAIRYAVDNGASIINMSFGKDFSPNKAYVDEAVKYAVAHDVLLVHAAGNDSENNDTDPNFPNDGYAKKGLFKPKAAKSWMEIGALSWKTGEKRVAGFSNYGKKNVDLFSPGVAIYSTTPENKYASFQGTSMASPAAAGVAAIIRSYYPELSAGQVKDILLASVAKQDGQVTKPGTSDKVAFSELCVSGGVVSTTNAIAVADKTKAKKSSSARWHAAGMAAGKTKPVLP